MCSTSEHDAEAVNGLFLRPRSPLDSRRYDRGDKMITNLPLLFVNGHPMSLDKMTVQEMERFIPFLVHCSWGRDTVKNIKKPSWWPQDVRFCNPLRKSNGPISNWTDKLRELIRNCYKFHCSEFLLKFCDDLSQNTPSALAYESNGDGTTSLYLKPSRRLLVTFRDENMLYDRKHILNARKCLLPHRPESDSTVESEIVEIYLCDTCDNAYESFEELQIHEKKCNPTETSQPSEETVETSPSTVVDCQQSFLAALGLGDASSKPAIASPVKNDISHSDERKWNARDRKTVLFNGLAHFPFSSPAGIRTLKLRRKWKEENIRPRECFERYCSAPPGKAECVRWMTKPAVRHFPIRYKGTSSSWHRTHLFSDQRNKTLLDVDGQLKLLACKPCSVLVNRLTAEQVESCIKLSKTNCETIVPVTETSTQNIIDDNDIEIVSVTVLNPNKTDSESSSIINELNDKKVLIKQEEKVFIPIKLSPYDVIDLCSDDDNHNENLHPSPLNFQTNNMNAQLIQSATPPKNLQPLAVNCESLNIKNIGSMSKMESINKLQSINISEVEHGKLRPLQQCQVLLYKHLGNNVISID